MEDFEFRSEKEPAPQGYQNRCNHNMAAAAVVLSVIGLVTPYFVFTTLVCGSLGIILGLLSKGGELKMDTNGKVAVILGIISLILVTLILILAVRFMLADTGGLEEMMDYYNTLEENNFSTYPDTL